MSRSRPCIPISSFFTARFSILKSVEANISICCCQIERVILIFLFCFFLFKLVQLHGLAWEILPPKKIVGNLNSNHLERRKSALQKYLKTVVTIFHDLPRPLIAFLEIDQFVSYFTILMKGT